MPEQDEGQGRGLEEAGDALPSKSELKRRMHALQALGASLVELGEGQLARIPIDSDELLEAIAEAKRIRSNSARKRHMQYIGKLMRDIDPAPIQRALDEIHEGRRQDAAALHDLESLRAQVLAAGPEGVEIVLQRWPRAERQKLRQLILQHQRESTRGKPPAASRKLFKYLRELQSQDG